VMMPFYLGLWVSTDSWTQDLLPEESRGRFLGILNIGYALGRVPGVLIATQVGKVYGILSIFLVAGIILWLGFPFFLKVPETLKT
ncbi:MAG TPA: MFS transporter, partial [Candidatus Deferrimicrobium sp.]|nr:MFS transporter [Candidatus Deferrimicrobium sp.]